ncbi:MAG: MBL fold metallo-hydrolase [Clostridia bacterium]|nr:MBL fold metallo-hydrolase [Clostridia bacterium]
MKKRIFICLLLVAFIFSLPSCFGKSKINVSSASGHLGSLGNDNSSFSIRFIDVGQGDSALVECDGHYMLIDGGPPSASETVRKVLSDSNVAKLDILAISHLHEDHFGGLIGSLSALYRKEIDLTISNLDYINLGSFSKFEHELKEMCPFITIPYEGAKYPLGSATVEVVDAQNKEHNDSLVLLITYKKNKFLFTGDIQDNAIKRLSQKYGGYSNKEYKVNLIKMPHHGAYYESLYVFLRTFMPDYAVISVGKGNQYSHPHSDTLKEWSNYERQYNNVKCYRTDENGDIIVKSNGHKLTVETSR